MLGLSSSQFHAHTQMRGLPRYIRNTSRSYTTDTLYLLHLSLSLYILPTTFVNYENPYRGRRTGPITSDYTAISYLPGVPRRGGRHRKKDKKKEKATQIDCAAAQWRCDILYVCNWTRVCKELNNAKSSFRIYGWEFAWGSSVWLQEGPMIDVSFREFTLANTFAGLQRIFTCV